MLKPRQKVISPISYSPSLIYPLNYVITPIPLLLTHLPAQPRHTGKILQERKNHDLTLENKRLEATEFRETVLESIKLASTTFGEGFNSFISDKPKLLNTVGSLTALALGIYTAKVSTGVIGRIIEARIGKPSLIRETSRKNYLQMVRSPFSTLKATFATVNSDNAIKDIVINPSVGTHSLTHSPTHSPTHSLRCPSQGDRI